MSLPGLRRISNVVSAMFTSKGGNQFLWTTIAVGIVAIVLIEVLLSGTPAGAAGQYAVAVMAGTGGLLWYRRPPETFEPNPGPARSLLAWAIAKGVLATLWLLEDSYEALVFLTYVRRLYFDVPFLLLFFITARPRGRA